ncbi:protein regulator of cytokinesis 1-like isoform X2 [Photinus pyralis]|uniref:protein regulator of cytokinesis 1-like isoform X2 n=1 Tax=Photinus pyralis TaxID=7054 RepID=UPI0012675770|nr:protein regulator of cytokinesis 1-like isoform X2 [Photinus pyralis]
MAALNNFEQLLQNVTNISEEKTKKWWDVVVSMMGTNDVTVHWSQIFVKQVTELFDEMIDESIQKRLEMLNKIEVLLQKSSSLCKDLNIKLPSYGSQQLTLCEEQEYLLTWISRHEQKLEEIKTEIKKLNKEEMLLMKSLGRTPCPLPVNPLPCNDTITKFKAHLEELESLKFEREEQYFAAKSEILNLVEELQYEPALDFERAVLSQNDSLFEVSDPNMEKVHSFLDSLKQLSAEMKEEIASLREKLNSMWDLLNEDLRVRADFAKKTTYNSKQTLKALQEEVARYEDLKRANIEQFVSRVRKELVTLWEKCHISEEERSRFEYFNSEVYSEDLLSIHDLELRKLHVYYSNNSDLFALLEKRSELWSRMLELENNASAPDRLKNRGCQLLKEEKERNTLQKRLPKIEQELIRLADLYAVKHKKPFYSYSKTVHEIIAETHSTLDEDKKQKLSILKQKREQTLTPGKLGMTSSLSVHNLAQTPQTGSKRKLLMPFEPPSTRSKILHERNFPATAPSKLAHAQHTGRSHYNTERAKRIQKCRRLSRRKLQNDLENVSTEYNMFEDLAHKEGCRSTLYDKENVLAIPLPATPQPGRTNYENCKF